MKSFYIIPFLFLCMITYAQEKKSTELQDQEKVLKEAKESEMKMKRESETKSSKKEKQNGLASEQVEEKKEQTVKTQGQNDQGKLLPDTASFEEVLALVPNRQNIKKQNIPASDSKVRGLPNTATLEEIRKTIPKN